MKFCFGKELLGDGSVPSVADDATPWGEAYSASRVGLEDEDAVAGVLDDHAHVVCIYDSIPES